MPNSLKLKPLFALMNEPKFWPNWALTQITFKTKTKMKKILKIINANWLRLTKSKFSQENPSKIFFSKATIKQCVYYHLHDAVRSAHIRPGALTIMNGLDHKSHSCTVTNKVLVHYTPMMNRVMIKEWYDKQFKETSFTQLAYMIGADPISLRESVVISGFYNELTDTYEACITEHVNNEIWAN